MPTYVPVIEWVTAHITLFHFSGQSIMEIISKSYGNGIEAKEKQNNRIIELWHELHERTFVKTLLSNCISENDWCLKFSLTLNGREWFDGDIISEHANQIHAHKHRCRLYDWLIQWILINPHQRPNINIQPNSKT